MAPLHFCTILVLLGTAYSQNYPSPCPDTFQYQQGPNGAIIGAIGVYTLNENVVRLNVELSVGNEVGDDNGRIELQRPKDQVMEDIRNKKPIMYLLFFPPWANYPPRVKKISVNGEVVCRGPPLPLGGFITVLTTVHLQHTLTIRNTVSPLGANPFLGDTVLNSFNSGKKPESQFNSMDKNPFLSSVGNIFNQNGGQSNGDFGAPAQPPRGIDNRVEPPPRPKPAQKPPPPQQPALPSTEQCGTTSVPNPLIFKGDSVIRGAFPWLVAMYANINTKYEYRCCGTLVSKRHIITAAHCLHEGRQKISPDKLIMVMGKLDITRWWLTIEGSVTAEVKDIRVHNDYVPLHSDADIGVVILAEEVHFNKYIKPICIWPNNDDIDDLEGQMGKVVGWGRDETGQNTTDEPKQVTIPIATQEQCLRSGEVFNTITSNRTFCAGSKDNRGPCNGDSGGGLIMLRDRRWTLRGIVSLSTLDQVKQTCDLNNYVVFTDVSKFLTWLAAVFSTP